ncbi:hypothetical protein B0H19DRAFT_1246049 [Mycena capillaripes]|nr:hypothetical protein B0H19DRAFT_1246049 [Mycena capillaripes]
MSSPLAFDSPCVTDGFNIIAVINLGLVLVRYHSETKRTSSHTLTVPDTVDLNDLHVVCVNDTAGAVHLIDTPGLFSTLRYV